MDYRPPNPPLLLLLLTSLLHFWQCAKGQPSHIVDAVNLSILPSGTVQSGTPVTIRCKVVVIHNNPFHLKNTFQFMRDDNTIHAYNTSDDTAVYELNPARAADSGNYECKVTVKDKYKSSSSERLTVTGLQTPTLLLSKNEPYVNEDFMATCSAPEEKGALIFRFYQKSRTRELKLLKETRTTKNLSKTKLVLHKVGDSHLYCEYDISLVSGARHSNRSNEIQVTVKVLYISPIMNVLPGTIVYERDVIEVVCKVVNPPSNTEVFLTKGRSILMQANVSLNHRFTVKDSDSGDFVCKAVWGNVQQETNQSITVKELFSKPVLTVNPKDVFEKDEFSLTCSVTIYAPEKISKEAVQLSIYKDNVTLTSEAVQLSIYKDNVTLTSEKTYTDVAHPKHNGNYTCKAQALSVARDFEKESQTVVVKAKIPVSVPMMSVVGGKLVLEKSFQLICHSANGTLPIKYTLYGPKRKEKVKIVSKPGDRAIFNTSAIYKSSDIEAFMCHATNNNRPAAVGQGYQLLHSTKIIEPVSEPVLTMQPEMGDISEGHDVTLVCTVQRGTPPITFTWYHTERKRALVIQSSNKLEGTYRILNVRGEDKGTYYCESTNHANETRRSRGVMIGVKMAGWKKGVIAVFCIVLLLALILVIYFKRHLLRFKKKRIGELSVKSASTKAERLSLTQAEVNEAANATPGMIGKSVWSEHVSGSESDDQNSVTGPENPALQYSEVQTRRADPNRVPVKRETEVVYSEVRNSKQGVPEMADDQGSVEYVQLNHDTDHHSDHGNHSNHSVQDDHLDEIVVTDTVDHDTADHGE